MLSFSTFFSVLYDRRASHWERGSKATISCALPVEGKGPATSGDAGEEREQGNRQPQHTQRFYSSSSFLSSFVFCEWGDERGNLRGGAQGDARTHRGAVVPLSPSLPFFCPFSFLQLTLRERGGRFFPSTFLLSWKNSSLSHTFLIKEKKTSNHQLKQTNQLYLPPRPRFV